jgi:hypothetical protein
MKFSKPLSTLGLAIGLFASASSQAALLGLLPTEPTIDFGGAGMISHDVATGLVTISGIPATLFQTEPFIYGEILGTGVDDEKLITIQFHVDTAGNFVSGVAGADLIVKGSVDTNFDGIADYDGILLEAEVTQFGFENGLAGGSDNFDLRLDSVTGVLAPLYSSSNLALNVTSETSTEFLTPFAGNFTGNFLGQAKGLLGAITALTPASCQIDVGATCSVGGAAGESKCRIKVSKSAKHWEHVEHEHNGHTFKRSEYGMHGNAVPVWVNRYPTTNVTFDYLITNKGTTPISNLLVTDSFDTPMAGIPAILAAGQSVTLTRTEQLNEAIDNTVTVMGEYQTAMCADTDVVVIKDKLREHRPHDEDNFKDKGKRD